MGSKNGGSQRLAGPVVVVAYSGGLDTSFLVARLARGGAGGVEGHPQAATSKAKVVAVTVDTGGFSDDDLKRIAKRARELGAAKHEIVDAREEVFERYVSYLIKGNVLRGGVYPLSVAAERYAQARHVALIARAEGAKAIYHGSTAAGNDQVRFDVSIRALFPDVQVRAPVRDEGLTREQERSWLEKEGLLETASAKKDSATGGAKAKYSINAGLWGTTAGGGELHDPWQAPTDEAFPLVPPPEEAAPASEEFDLEFESGMPRGAWGSSKSGVELVSRLNETGRRHGIGRGIHLGDTVIGVKGRIAFEAPAAMILVTAHRELEKLVLTSWQRLLKDQIALTYGQLFHEGLYHEPAMRDMEAYFDKANEHVTGTVRVRLYRGNVTVLGVQSPHSLMDRAVATYGEQAKLWDGRDAQGFAKIFGVPSLLSARRDARVAKSAEEPAPPPPKRSKKNA
jgi:argininosuccinate synthase